MFNKSNEYEYPVEIGCIVTFPKIKSARNSVENNLDIIASLEINLHQKINIIKDEIEQELKLIHSRIDSLINKLHHEKNKHDGKC